MGTLSGCLVLFHRWLFVVLPTPDGRQRERTLEAHVREFSATTSQKIACDSFREDFSDRRSTSARTVRATWSDQSVNLTRFRTSTTN
ncbi:hypothetical protein T02_5284 [Trichinella nativa]|uniref:Secreted protein n=1 Tax=Trichinella nativa TaxID=6335 RepID=A0A0V1LHI2_9BILA|nr:hypothetical protein T02_5284 [Trichinella nativa]